MTEEHGKLIEAIARAMAKQNSRLFKQLAIGGGYPSGAFDPTDKQLAQTALTAITEAGYAVVPREPTEAMCAEASEPAQAAALYRAMISAAQGGGE